jgi:hypothetical protein
VPETEDTMTVHTRSLAAAVIMLAAATAPAHATNTELFECGIVTETPAPSKKEVPVYKIRVESFLVSGRGRKNGV